MSELFLSASVPVVGRGNYVDTADPFLIQFAVRELVIAAMKEGHRIVWGGHPAITPMIWAICEYMKVNYSDRVVLYQSRFFEDRFPEENQKFQNVIYVDAVEQSREKSLLRMRREMLGRPGLVAAFFIGGMDGTEEEFNIFQEQHPNRPVIPVPSTGGAALNIAKKLSLSQTDLIDTNYVNMFTRELKRVE